MCEDLGVTEYSDLKSPNLNKRSVFKCQGKSLWMAWNSLLHFAQPHLQMAVYIYSRANWWSQHFTARIKDPQTIIDLQNKLIEKRDEELKSLTNIVHVKWKRNQSTARLSSLSKIKQLYLSKIWPVVQKWKCNQLSFVNHAK